MNQQLLPITFYWKAQSDVKDWYVMKLLLTKDGKNYYDKNRNVGYTIYPSNAWKKGDMIKEYYAYYLPKLEPGKYMIEIILFNSSQERLKRDGDNIANAAIIGKLNVGR